MQKQLNIRQFVISTLSFMAKNWFLLCLFGIVLFFASFLSFKYAFKHHIAMLGLYGAFCYVFYYLFISLYYNQKPIFTSEKLVNSIVTMIVVFLLSLVMVLACDLVLKLLKYMAQWLVGFPDLYKLLKETYLFLKASTIGQFLIYIPLIFFLTFTFFIPGFAWISTLNGRDASIWGAYAKVHGNYLMTVLLMFAFFAVVPFIINLFVVQKPVFLSISHALSAMIQLVGYVRLYDFFYEEQSTTEI